jgi:hypothetical protein
MLRFVTVVLVAGCSAATPAPPRAPAVPARPPGAERWIFRQVRLGPRIASRTTLELVVDGGRASLVEIDESEGHALSLPEVDRGTRWQLVGRRTYRGTAAKTAGSLELALSSEGVQPLQLHCVPHSIAAGAPGALRVRSVNPSSDGRGDGRNDDREAWEPPATVPVQAMVCDAGITDPEADDDDALMFARPPGLEYVSVTDGGARASGVRILQ